MYSQLSDLECAHPDSKYVHCEKQLQTQYGQKSKFKKAWDILKTCWYEIKWLSIAKYKSIYTPPNFLFHNLSGPLNWLENSQGLYVLIHGLRLHPIAWEDHLRLLENKKDKFDVFVPFVPHAGECTLEEAAQPILNAVLDYIGKHPHRPICLIGMSNGGRIALWIEIQLRTLAPKVDVMISVISGVFFGTRIVNWLCKNSVTKKLVGSQVVCDELAYGNLKARRLLDQAQAPFDSAKRTYEFYACTEDLELIDLQTALPIIGKGEQYHVVQGKGHHSIIPVICTEQVHVCMQWMEEQSQDL